MTTRQWSSSTDSKTGFSAANLSNVDRAGWNLAEICCCTEH